MRKWKLILLAGTFIWPMVTMAQNSPLKQTALTDLQGQYNHYKNVKLQIWNFAEVG
jgi:hypothetical protein